MRASFTKHKFSYYLLSLYTLYTGKCGAVLLEGILLGPHPSTESGGKDGGVSRKEPKWAEAKGQMGLG